MYEPIPGKDIFRGFCFLLWRETIAAFILEL
jgi:hypothetical protein